MCRHRGFLIALAARTPLDAKLEVMAAGFAANVSGQAHIAWHVSSSHGNSMSWPGCPIDVE
jgi:hypothetical protein